MTTAKIKFWLGYNMKSYLVGGWTFGGEIKMWGWVYWGTFHGGGGVKFWPVGEGHPSPILSSKGVDEKLRSPKAQ